MCKLDLHHTAMSWLKRPALFFRFPRTSITLWWVLFGGGTAWCALSPAPEGAKSVPVYTLQDCLDLGLTRNPDIQRAEQDIERSKGLVITAKSLLYPRVGLSGRIEERNDDLLSEGTDPRQQRFREYWTVSISATQSLYSGGANRQQIAIAKLENEASLGQLRSVTNRVLRDIHHAVFETVVGKAQIEAQEKTVQLLTEELKRQKQYFDAGKTTRFNVLRTQVSLSNQEVQLLQARSQYVSSQIALARLLNIGWPPDGDKKPPFLVSAELTCPPVKETAEELAVMALSRRPELDVLQREIEISERKVKVEKASNIPRVDAFAGYEVRRDLEQSSFDDSVQAATVGILGSWNIFDGFAGRGRKLSAEAALQSRRISLDKTRLQVRSEVGDAFARLQTAGESVRVQGSNIQTAEESVKLSQNSLDAGYATLLDVLQATVDLTTARLEAIRAKQRYMKALADLQFAVSLKFQDEPEPGAGTGTPPAEIPPARLKP